MQVSFTELALADIDNIRTYIAQARSEAASRMAVALVAAGPTDVEIVDDH